MPYSEALAQSEKSFDALEQRLCRNTSLVETNPANVLLLHKGDFLSHLPRMSRRFITAGAGADNYEIVHGDSLHSQRPAKGLDILDVLFQLLQETCAPGAPSTT